MCTSVHSDTVSHFTRVGRKRCLREEPHGADRVAPNRVMDKALGTNSFHRCCSDTPQLHRNFDLLGTGADVENWAVQTQ